MKIMFYFVLKIKLELCNKIWVVESTCIANLCLGIFNDNLHSWFYDTWVSTSFCAFTSSITPLNDSTLTYREKWSLLYLILLFCKYTYWYVNLSWSIKHAKQICRTWLYDEQVILFLTCCIIWFLNAWLRRQLSKLCTTWWITAYVLQSSLSISFGVKHNDEAAVVSLSLMVKVILLKLYFNLYLSFYIQKPLISFKCHGLNELFFLSLTSLMWFVRYPNYI